MGNSITFMVGGQMFVIGCILLFLQIHAEGKKRKIPALNTEDIRRCPICTYVYLDREHDELFTCPRCGSINKTGEK